MLALVVLFIGVPVATTIIYTLRRVQGTATKHTLPKGKVYSSTTDRVADEYIKYLSKQ